MNTPGEAVDCFDMLIGALEVVTASEEACVQPKLESDPSHNAFSRLLQRLEPDPETL